MTVNIKLMMTARAHVLMITMMCYRAFVCVSTVILDFNVSVVILKQIRHNIYMTDAVLFRPLLAFISRTMPYLCTLSKIDTTNYTSF